MRLPFRGRPGLEAGTVFVGDALCPNGHSFRYLTLGDMHYGTLFARTQGHTALVETFGDPVFDEVFALVEELAPSLDEDARVTAGHEAFEYACDPDPDGRRYTLGGLPCTRCGAEAVQWGRTDGSAPEPPPVTHTTWLASDAATRREIVERALRGSR